MTNPLETARLVLQPIQHGDAEQIQIIFPQWEIVRYLASTVPWPYPADGAHAFCRDASCSCRMRRRVDVEHSDEGPVRSHHRSDRVDERRGQQPWFLAGTSLARARSHNRSVRCGDRLLVRRAQVFRQRATVERAAQLLAACDAALRDDGASISSFEADRRARELRRVRAKAGEALGSAVSWLA